MDRLKTLVASHAEDLALAIGALLLSVGTGIAAGYEYGMMAAGALLVAYGAWIAKGA